MLPSSPMFIVRSILFLWCLLAGIGLMVASAFAASPAEPLNIVVTIPVLKDLAQQVGGDHVKVTSLLNGYENEHTYSPRPSDLVAVRKARLLFEVGIGMDPENVAIMLRHITEALIAADPAHATDFRNRQAVYLQQLDRIRKELSGRVKQLPDRRFVAHHPAWPYLARRFGFDVAATIQLQSGTEPSALQLQTLISKIKKDRIKVIVSEIQLSQKLPDLLAKETKARVVVLTTLPGGLPGTETYLDMLRYNVLQLANALEFP